MAKFHFFPIIDKIAGGDLLKYEAVCEIEISLLFLKLEMDAEKDALKTRYLEIKRKLKANANRKKA
jgi:hypothetical protein